MINPIKSRNVWIVAILFIINGFSGIRDLIPAGILPVVDAALSLLAIYFRIVPKQGVPTT